MGVQGLWTLVTPAARPTQLESLRNRKMAVDASIWIHQFMRTMRDKEGNALRNGHLLGFFRRLCKLLFYNIKPVFVFDGGAPALKRSTIKERRRRREGITNNLKRTAEKILSAQVKTRVLLEEERKRKGETEPPQDEDYTYFDELEKNAALENIKQKLKRDQYELPAMPSNENMKKIDPRLATQQELIDFINEYRPSQEEIDSEAFLALPPDIQFEIVRDLGMESRKTSWARLDQMVRQSRTALDFSKQQIKLLMHRNDMTQRMLQMSERPNTRDGNNGSSGVPTRIAGERSREYMLVKNENADEGLGWKLPGLNSSATATTTTTTTATTNNESSQKEEGEELEVVVDNRKKTDCQQVPPQQEPEDKVKNALASNPKLAALMAKFQSDDDEEEEEKQTVQEENIRSTNQYHYHYQLQQQETDQMEYYSDFSDEGDYYYEYDDGDEDEPLFLQPSSDRHRASLVDDMQAYVEDDEEAVNEVIRRIYANEAEELPPSEELIEQTPSRTATQLALPSSQPTLTTTTPSVTVPAQMPESVDPNEMYQLWLSRAPDSFIYLHSINDEYKRLLCAAVFDYDIPQLESQLKRVQKLYGKTSDRDKMGLSALGFQEQYMSNILQWKRYQQQLQQPDTNMADSAVVDSPSMEHEEKSSRDPLQPSSSSPLSTESTQPQRQQINESLTESITVNDSKPFTVPNNKDSSDLTMKGQQHQSVSKKHTTTIVAGALSPASEDYVMVDDEDEDEIDIPLPDNAITRKDKSKMEQQQLPSPEKTIVQESITTASSPPTAAPSHSQTHVDSNESRSDEFIKEIDQDQSMNDQQQLHYAIDTLEKVSEVAEQQEQPQQSTEELEQEYKAAKERAEEQHGYNSDEELVGGVDGEEDEFARFVSDIANKDIESVRQELHRDMNELNKQQRKDMGNSDEVTNQMIQDIQELLKLFGIPYVVSPMEAEAQCAELARLSLVEGVVTDDSDVFLFGGTRIYKNMFNQQKYVECYVMQDLEREMRLDRSKLVQLAFLLGSDYTDGIAGVGPVAAIEILAEFTKEDNDTIAGPLERFRDWYQSGKDENEFQRKLRKKHKNLEIPEDFPNELVIEAYYHPMVESSQEEFKWGTPQLDMLRSYLIETFGWPENKADEVLIPVIREMNKRKVMTITNQEKKGNNECVCNI
ncbi:hypothetical protein BDA99DRAFT_499957 [Phascolomyces articulosus]|uniref:Uncharacterized protein n=1 Tax=Phascolomyces articulosus TaxID=60185 RepID=A0AAD5K7Z8_9FUNG|nr:hypothetical protein BDA99DRAFT_499957 [Phascolomyces articulosus]